MRSAFIVSVENNKGTPVSAEGLRMTLSRSWDRFSGIYFSVEEGGIGALANMVSSYLEAEEDLEKYMMENQAILGQSLDSPTGEKWRELYDKVREKKTILIGALRKYGHVV